MVNGNAFRGVAVNDTCSMFGKVISEMVMIHFLTGLKWWKTLIVSVPANGFSINAGLILF